jgi:hypothetical protein
MGVFEDIIAGSTPEDRAVIERHPQLKASIAQLEADRAAMAPYAAKVAAWDEWQAKNWNQEAEMTNREKALSDKVAEQETRLAAAATAGAGVSAAEIAKLTGELAKTKEEFGKQMGGIKYFFGAVANRIGSHRDEFGENFDQQKLFDYMTNNKINDADVAYDKMMASRRSEMASAKATADAAAHTAAVEAARLAGIEAGRMQAAQERAMGPAGFSPTDETGGIVGVTSRVARDVSMSQAAKDAIASAKPGDGSLARLGYAAFMNGDLGPVQ